MYRRMAGQVSYDGCFLIMNSFSDSIATALYRDLRTGLVEVLVF